MQKSDEEEQERVGLDFFYLFEDDENLKDIDLFFFLLFEQSVCTKKRREVKKTKKTSSLSRSSDKGLNSLSLSVSPFKRARSIITHTNK